MTALRKIAHYQDYDEKEVIENAKQSPEAFKPLYERYFQEVFRFVYAKVKDRDCTADITSEVFVKAMQNLDKYVYRGYSFKSWLFKIAYNSVIDHFRKTKVVMTVQWDSLSEIVEESFAEHGENKEALFQKMESALAVLSHQEVSLLELRYYQEEPIKSIAFIVELSEANVKVRLHRIIKKLREAVQQQQ